MTTKLGPWPLGIDNRSPRAALRRDEDGNPVALADAANVNIDRAGRPSRRAGRASVLASAMHSLWSGPLGAFAVLGDQLCRVSVAGTTPLATLNSADRCSYTVLNDEVVIGNRTTLLRVAGNSVSEIGPPNAAAPFVAASTTGGLYEGRYTVAVAAMDGDVIGGLSPLRAVQVQEGGGIELTAMIPPGATGLRVYRSRAGGDELYRCADLSANADGVLLGAGILGEEESTRGLRKMMPGQFVANWNGRLLVGNGRTLSIGEPLRYGLFSPRHGFVQFAEPITFVAPVAAGVFVGLSTTVMFLRGSRPGEWVQEATGADAPVPGSVAELVPDEHGMEMQGTAVMWLSRAGYAIGTSDGLVVAPQAGRLRLPRYVAGATCVTRRRALTVITL